MVRRIVSDKVTKQYIFAIDRSKKPAQKKIVEAISKGIGSGSIKDYDWMYSEEIK